MGARLTPNPYTKQARSPLLLLLRMPLVDIPMDLPLQSLLQLPVDALPRSPVAIYNRATGYPTHKGEFSLKSRAAQADFQAP